MCSHSLPSVCSNRIMGETRYSNVTPHPELMGLGCDTKNTIKTHYSRGNLCMALHEKIMFWVEASPKAKFPGFTPSPSYSLLVSNGQSPWLGYKRRSQVNKETPKYLSTMLKKSHYQVSTMLLPTEKTRAGQNHTRKLECEGRTIKKVGACHICPWAKIESCHSRSDVFHLWKKLKEK